MAHQALSFNDYSPHFPLRVMEAQHTRDTAPHSHDFWEMVYVRSGRGEHWIDDSPYPIQTGDLYVIVPGELHRYSALPGQTIRIVNVLWTPDLVEAILRAERRQEEATPNLGYIDPLLNRDLRFVHRLHLSGRTAFRVEVLLDEMRREQAAAASGHELMLRHLFCALLVLLSRAHAAQHGCQASEETAARLSAQQIVARAVAYLEEHAARPVKIEEVARHVGLSPSRLSHLFKDHTGRSVIAYLHELRIAQASAALLDKTAGVEAIAAAAGFSDPRFFTRVFRRHTGATPSEYRRRFAAS